MFNNVECRDYCYFSEHKPTDINTPMAFITECLTRADPAIKDLTDLRENVLAFVMPYLSLKDTTALRSVSKSTGTIVDATRTCVRLALTKQSIGDICIRIFSVIGHGLLELSMHRVTFPSATALSDVLALCPNLRKLSISDADWTNWDDNISADAIIGCKHLRNIRLQCGDISTDRHPFDATICSLHKLTTLESLTLFTRLRPTTRPSLCEFIRTAPKLRKVKISTSVMASFNNSVVDAGAGAGASASIGAGTITDLTTALANAKHLAKLTIVRPDGMGEPIRKNQCLAIAVMLAANKNIHSLHIRRCGMWTDTLDALVPPMKCPHLESLKLDGNSLGYLSGSYFNVAMDSLLSKLPNIKKLHLGNNQLDSSQASGLAASFERHSIVKLENLTLGSNDIGDVGLAAVLPRLPVTMKQLYLHGVDATDASTPVIRDMLERCPDLWGLGLNGNPITDTGARTLARGIRGHKGLHDVGFTLSEMSDVGLLRLANALHTCPNLRYAYVYTVGFKAAQKVTAEGMKKLKDQLPKYATLSADHRMSRYLKTI